MDGHTLECRVYSDVEIAQYTIPAYSTLRFFNRLSSVEVRE